MFLVKGSSSKHQFENWSRASPLTDRAEPVQRLHGSSSSSKNEFEKLGGVDYCHLVKWGASSRWSFRPNSA